MPCTLNRNQLAYNESLAAEKSKASSFKIISLANQTMPSRNKLILK